MWIFPWIKLSWRSSSIWDKLRWLIDSDNLSVVYLLLIRKDSSTHMHDLAVYVEERLPFAREVSLENSTDSYWCFRLALLHSVPYFFFLYRSPSSALCTVFDSISSNIEEVLSINPSANERFFRDFQVHHKDWLTYSEGYARPGEFCYIFSISNDLTQIVNFPTRIPDCDSHSPALLDLFLSSDFFYYGFLSIGKFWSCCCLSFHWHSVKIKTGFPVLSYSFWLFSCWSGRSL